MKRLFDRNGLVMDSEPPMIFRNDGASHAKTKARDIIEGWPQGRSTMGEFHSVEDRIHYFALRQLFRTTITAEEWAEIQETFFYHKRQNDMVQDWLRDEEYVAWFRQKIQETELPRPIDPPCRAGDIMDGMRSYDRHIVGPYYWMWETSGILQPVIKEYLNNRKLTPVQISILKLYLRQWIRSSVWKGPPVEALRKMADVIESQEDIDEWITNATECGIDPL